MTSPGPTHQPAAMHARPAKPEHAERHLLCGQGGSPGNWRGYGAGWSGAWAASLTALAFLAAGCSARQPAADLPRKTPHASAAALDPSPAPTPAAVAERQGVIAAYLAIWAAGDRAERSMSAAAAQAILGPYTTAAYARSMVAGMSGYWARHELARGRMIDHVTRVALLTGRGGRRAAIVVDCQDASHHHLVSAGTGRIIPGSRGPSQAGLQASLTHANGRWQVGNITFTGNSCAR
jgi:hypothetical protein